MISILKFLKSLPVENKREAWKYLNEAEAANGRPFLRKTFRELKNTADFIRASNGFGHASIDGFLNQHNPSERMIVHGLMTESTDEEYERVARRAKNEAMKTRKTVRAALELAAPQELRDYDKQREADARKNKQKPIPRQPGTTRPLFGPGPY